MDGLLIGEARELRGELFDRNIVDLSPCIINLRCARFGLAPHKKGAGVALTRLATLRHNNFNFVRECVHCERSLAQPMPSGWRPL